MFGFVVPALAPRVFSQMRSHSGCPRTLPATKKAPEQTRKACQADTVRHRRETVNGFRETVNGKKANESIDRFPESINRWSRSPGARKPLQGDTVLTRKRFDFEVFGHEAVGWRKPFLY